MTDRKIARTKLSIKAQNNKRDDTLGRYVLSESEISAYFLTSLIYENNLLLPTYSVFEAKTFI